MMGERGRSPPGAGAFQVAAEKITEDWQR